MSNGMLSQAISNIQQLEPTIRGFNGLPSQAVPIQQDTLTQLDNLLPQVIAMQQQVLALGQTLQSQLNKQMSGLSHMTPDQLRTAIEQIESETKPISQQVTQTNSASHAANEKIINDNITLQQISVSLQAEIAGLQSNLAGAKQELNALNKKKLYLIGLGIFGLPGLIALAVLLTKAQNEVNSLNGNINKINQQIQSEAGFVTQTQSLSGNFSTAVTKISQLENSIDFLSGDIANIDHDIGSATQAQLQLMFATALMEVNTLVNDAS